MQKTAMQELIDYFIDNHGYLTGDAFLKKAQSLVEKEKQQIIEAYGKARNGTLNGGMLAGQSYVGYFIYKTAEEYYAENYGS